MLQVFLYVVIALVGSTLALLIFNHSKKYQRFMVSQLNQRDSEYDEIYAKHD